MNPAIFILGLTLLLAPAAIIAAEWIGLEDDDPILLGIELGHGGSDDFSQTATLGLPLGSSAGFIGQYSTTRYSQDEDRFDSLLLHSRLWLELGELLELAIEHQFEGNHAELEKESFALGLGYRLQDWQIELQLASGELVVFTREEVFDLFDALPDRFSSDLQAVQIAIERQGQAWYWRAIRTEYDYESDVSRLASSRLLQFIVKAPALAQTSLLLANSSSLSIGYSGLDNDYGLQLSRDRSAIDSSHSDAILLSVNHWSDDDIGYLLAVSLPVESSSFGLSLGLQWTL